MSGLDQNLVSTASRNMIVQIVLNSGEERFRVTSKEAQELKLRLANKPEALSFRNSDGSVTSIPFLDEKGKHKILEVRIFG